MAIIFTDDEIKKLVAIPKKIKARSPARGYKEENGHKRCSLILEFSAKVGEAFSVFIRQNTQLIENYSIGLRYQTSDRVLGAITLVRYNGPHGEASQHQDGHYDKPHIHCLTAEELRAGSVQPQERRRELTGKYRTFEDALKVFFKDVGVMNYQKYFPELCQGDMFSGH